MGTPENTLSDLSQNNSKQNVFFINDEPVMKISIDVLEKLGNLGKVTLRARGERIPSAVAVSNILTEKMMKGNSKIEKITLDSEVPTQMGRMISTIEIVLVKN